MLYLIQKELKHIMRNTFLPRIIIAFPIMAILVIPWVANMEIKDVNLAILDFDSSQTSKKIVAKISATSYFNMVLDSKNIYEARECLYTNQCDIILEFPNGFEEYLVAEHKANVGIYANAINSTKGALGSGYLAQVIAQFASSESHSTPLGTLMPTYNPQILSIYRFNPNLDYKIFMIPALMVMVLTMLCGFLPALNIVSEKERGNIEQINVTPKQELELVPRVGSHILFLGKAEDYNEKFRKLQTFYEKVLSQVGWNKYERISVEFNNQIICTKKEK